MSFRCVPTTGLGFLYPLNYIPFLTTVCNRICLVVNEMEWFYHVFEYVLFFCDIYSNLSLIWECLSWFVGFSIWTFDHQWVALFEKLADSLENSAILGLGSRLWGFISSYPSSLLLSSCVLGRDVTFDLPALPPWLPCHHWLWATKSQMRPSFFTLPLVVVFNHS